EVPKQFTQNLREDAAAEHVDLFSERYEVRESAKRNLYTGKTYNSLENIAQFFVERGIAAPRPPAPAKEAEPVAKPIAKPAVAPARPPARKKPFGPGSMVTHPKYGR